MIIRRFTKSIALVGAAALMASGLVLGSVTPAGALTVDVTTTTDGEPGSLRDAIDDINAAGAGPHTINLASGLTYELDECALGDNGGLTINVGPVTINGNRSTVRQTCDDARVFRFNSEEQLTINDLTVTGGNRSGSSNGGGLKTFGPTEINRSTFILNDAGGNGGAIWSDDELVFVSDSTFTDNNADLGGGAIYSLFGFVEVDNSTFEGNSATEGGGIYAIEQLYYFVTMVGNEASFGGAAMVTEVVESFGSVFADNISPNPCSASLDSNGYNWADDEDCDFGGDTDIVEPGGDPRLGPLANNGGPTHTMLPEDGSPLVDAIPAEVRDCDGTDQRGVSRPQNGACDIGAVEIAFEDPIVPTTPTSTTTSTRPGTVAATVTPRFTG